MPSDNPFPTTANRTTLAPSMRDFLSGPGKDLHLGGNEPFTSERRTHQQVLGIQNIPGGLEVTIGEVEFTAFRGPHGTVPVRVLYPTSGEQRRKEGKAGALIYFHGGGYTVGSVDEFERGLRIVAEESGCQIYAVDYRLAPEWQFPTQIEEYIATLKWLRGEAGRARGVDPALIAGGGDSAGGNMTAAASLWIKDKEEGVENLKAQVLLYPEARVPFDTPAAEENNSGYYLVRSACSPPSRHRPHLLALPQECNGIFSFADHYCPRGTPPSNRYISPGMQPSSSLSALPRAHIFTAGFDPLRDVGVEYAHKLRAAGNEVGGRTTRS
ncbi:hypothetical protein JCM8097_009176 [Rhodosporidiobolus ruineniae]